jgi:predicted transcriptional regulator
MTPEPPPPPSSGSSSSADDFDFSALVAEHNQATASKNSPASRPKERAVDSEPVDQHFGSTSASSSTTSDANGSSSTIHSRWWRFGYPVLVGAILVVVLPLLIFVGLRVILDSSDGQLVKRVTDPTAPGYEAVVEKTPTAIAAVLAPDGTLDSAVVFALTSESSGGVLLVPGTLGIPTKFGMFPLTELWKADGIDAVAEGLGRVLNLNFTEKVTLNPSDWSTLVGPYAPFSFTNPDAVRDAKDAVLFPKGSVTLKADQIASFLTSKSAKDNDSNRLLRDELFWKAWLSKVKSSGAAFPVTIDSGIGRFVASVARGQLSVSSLPVVPVAAGSPFPGGGAMCMVQEAAASDAVAAIVPFPDGAPGARPRIRVLDGTGKLSNGINAAIILNAAGGQVDVVGNAKSYGQKTTQIIYFDGTSRETAQKMLDALTVGEIVESKQSNSGSDMTVMLGEDFLTKYGPTSGSSSLGSSSTSSKVATTSTTVRK